MENLIIITLHITLTANRRMRYAGYGLLGYDLMLCDRYVTATSQQTVILAFTAVITYILTRMMWADRIVLVYTREYEERIHSISRDL
jgi:hypothetical protein